MFSAAAIKRANDRVVSMTGRRVLRYALTILALMLTAPFNQGGTVEATTCPLSLKFKTSEHVVGRSIKVTYMLANTGYENTGRCDTDRATQSKCDEQH